LDLEKCKLFFCSISFIFYRTKFLSNLKLLWNVFCAYFNFCNL
jgi:hypothetical protein